MTRAHRSGQRCSRARRALCIGPWLASAALAAMACNAYNSALLDPDQLCGDAKVEPGEMCDTGIEADHEGACPTQCPEREGCTKYLLTGEGCRRACVATLVTAAEDGDGCCPDGLTMLQDDDCDLCGDGVVGVRERCDPPGSCPTEQGCTERTLPCLVLTYSGSAETCTALCEVSFISQCIDEDGCCPASCGRATDGDCSAVCGDGELDESSGETCEPSAPDAPCPSSCDDGDPCTLDTTIGSAANCNVLCTHTPREPAAGDDCCPTEATAATDADCATLFRATLAHRYRFTGQGTTVHDWFGTADGTAIGSELNGDGTLELSGGAGGPYVNLPNRLVSSQTSVTLEAWVTLHDLQSPFQRIFDFGASSNGEDQPGESSSFLYLAASGQSGAPRVAFQAGGNPRVAIDAPGPAPLDTLVQLAVVIDGAAQRMTLYVAGESAASADITTPLSALIDVNNWLGRSQFEQDPGLEATLHEFRIYNAALTPEDIAMSAAAGPDPGDR